MNCPKCGTENPVGFRFCGHCGHKVVEAAGNATSSRTMFFGAMQQPNRAKLILIKGEGLDGVSYHLAGTEHISGRSEGDICFPDDPLLSPRHCCFYYDGDKLMVRDENAVNGVFIRITQGVPLYPGGKFLLGEQLMQFALIEDDAHTETDSDGTMHYGSPRRPGCFRLYQILRGGDIGMIFRAPTEQITLGREGNDINFPDDPFISGQHAMVSVTPQGYLLTDLGSKNGTFIRINEPRMLIHGDYVFIGQQLFRVEIT